MSIISGLINYIPTNYEILECNENEIAHIKGKKRRLDNLTWEEKLQRKKLKNRVAAQTSRDRKKAKIDQMEKTIENLFKKNEKLVSECEELKQLNHKLLEENASLQTQLKNSNGTCVRKCLVGCEAQQGSAESFPLPQGLKQKLPATVLNPQVLMTALWKTVLACLLYQTCSTSSKTMMLILNPLKSSHKASYKILPQTWKLLLKKQIMRNQFLIKNSMNKEWWGRHQKMWNPVDVTA